MYFSDCLMGELNMADGKIRLACIVCDREDFDGVNKLPADWESIDEMQSYEEAISDVDINDTDRSVLDWFTHLGYCPECLTMMTSFEGSNQ